MAILNNILNKHFENLYWKGDNTKTKKYLIDFIKYSYGFIISSFVGFVLTIVINKNLSQEELGKFSYYRSLIDFYAVVLTLNIYKSYLRYNFNGINSILYRIVKKINLISIIVISVIIIYITNSILPAFYSLTVIYNERMYLYRSILNINELNKIRIYSILSTLIISIITVYTLGLDYKKCLFAYGFGYLLSFFINKKVETKFSNEKTKVAEILNFSLPIFFVTLITTAQSTLTQYFLKYFFDYEELSKFAIATRVMMFFTIFSSMFIMFFPTLYYREIECKNIRLIRSFQIAFSIFLIIFATICIFFRELIYNLMGASKYLEYTEIFIILICAQILMIFTNIWGMFISYTKKTFITLVASIIAITINLLLQLVFLEKYGIFISAYSMLIANAIYTTIIIYISTKLERKFLKR